MEARHRCMHCDAEYIVGYTIPKISTSSRRSGGSGGGGGGSFGGGSSGGGGLSSRFEYSISILTKIAKHENDFIMGILSFFAASVPHSLNTGVRVHTIWKMWCSE